MQPIAITRARHRLLPDARRVLAKLFLPGDELLLPGTPRAPLLLERILAIPEALVPELLDTVLREFGSRHRGFEQLLDRNFVSVSHHLPPGQELSIERRLLIGAYFTHEYSVEAAALFNPSLVLAPEQHDAAVGTARVVMSLRAVGEGHISSIEFRSGWIDDAGELYLDAAGPYLVPGHRTPPAVYNKSLFRAKLYELDAGNVLSGAVLGRLPEYFSLADLEESLALLEPQSSAAIGFETAKIIRILAASSYITEFPADSQLSERVIFPAGPNETRGMEDARFVRFTEEDGTHTYYATYTAYDGFNILPQLIETKDFVCFAISTLHGAAAQNKGMALFPRRIGGRYVMLSRKDRENLHLATSTDVHLWEEATELHRPVQPWELIHIGNCGSPLETEAGWLVLTHGVGPMRRYTLGALLLDLEDPSRVIGQLPAPLLEPDASEREGYVPNVLYSCGALLHRGQILLPYGFSDSGVGMARIGLSELLAQMR